jgi:hypothetical protein
LFDAVDARLLAQRDEWNRDVRLAWRIADLVVATWAKGRTPDLQSLLMQERSTWPQSLAEQKAALQILAGRLGRPLQQKGWRRQMRKALR